MKKVKKMAIGGGSSLSSVLGLLPPRPGSFNNPSNIGFGNGPRLPPNLPPRDFGTGSGPRRPTNLPPSNIGTGNGPRLPPNRPPRDPGTGGPRFIDKTPGSIGANPNRSVSRDGPNDAPQSVMDAINLGKNPVGLGNGMAAGPIGKNAPTGKAFNFGSIGMSGPSIAQQTSGYKKGGVIPASKISTATKNKKNPNW